MIGTAKKNGHKAIVHGAAASALGKMLVKYSKKMDLPLINIVRSEEQVKTLQNLGAEHILNSTSDSFDADLKAISKELEATAYFDPIAGDLTKQVLVGMPPKSTAYVYGGLSGKPITIDVLTLIFYQKTVSYLYLDVWFKDASPEDIKNAITEVATDLATGGKIFGTKIFETYPITKLEEAIDSSNKNASKGKVIFNPQL